MQKITAQKLEAAGFTQAEIDRWFQIQDRQRYYGRDGLTRSDRDFLGSAKKAVAKIEMDHQKALIAGAFNRLSGKTPLQEKSHYKWVKALRDSLKANTELAPNEVSCNEIIQDELLRALEIYQPKLDRMDTQIRSKFIKPVAELISLGTTFDYSRVVQIDSAAVRSELQSEFASEWNSAWDSNNVEVVAILMEDEREFGDVVRPIIEGLTREIFRSVKVAD